MSVAFRELGGSPREQYDANGFSARREFLIAWEDRDAFAVEVLGEAAQYGGTFWTTYPGKPSVFAVRIRFEPIDADRPDRKELAGLTEGLNSYSNSFAKAVVEYETVNELDREDGPENEDGTQISYKMLFSAEYQPIGPGGWSWVDTSDPLPADQPLVKWVPMTEHHLTWRKVVHPPWTMIQALQGTVNQSEFLGCPAGTLLFEGAQAGKLYAGDIASGPSPFCWEIKYLFRERSIKHDGNVHGWNHFYREDPAGWAEATNGTAKMYDEADFNALFQSAPGA
ncbi:MAG TPA: hypothetical protein VJL29_11135 [Thermoguttaceae bacterium]|nr:hypothetical protein [Thermoguttaceae bacterium]